MNRVRPLPRARQADREWARYAPAPIDGVTRLHARFAGHVFERHSHDTFSIGATTGGVQRFDCRGARHDSVPGDVILFNPDEPHDGRAASADGFFCYEMLYLSPAAMSGMLQATDRAALSVHLRAPHVHDPASARALLAAVESMAQPGETLRAQTLLAGALRQLFARHGDASLPAVPDDAARQRLDAVREFIDAHHAEDLRVEALAALAGLSRAHLTRAFACAYGAPPHAYLNAVRLRHAQQALRRGQTIADAAAAAGFADQSHFTRRFKGAFGVPPGAWLAQMQAG
jgi:AraC-like DNA-binding protein